jgi:molybdopterin/thiamine biosynthesis adenylyltransferase
LSLCRLSGAGFFIHMKGKLDRYSRQVLFEGIGESGQRRIGAARVVLIGCGALGTVIANNLARAGVGHLTVVDRDFVEESNLQRQVLFDEEDVRNSLPKAMAAEKKLRQINSQIEIKGVVTDVSHANIEDLVRGATLVMDGSDNFETRFLVNDACVKHGIPWFYGACVGSYGLSMVILPRETPCLRCIFETAPPPGMSPTCDTSGIIAPIVNIIASFQCMEAIKLLTGATDKLNRDLLSMDVWDDRFERFKLQGRRELADCPCCVHNRYDFLSAGGASQTTTLCGRNSVQISFPQGQKINFEEVRERLAKIGKVTSNPFLLRCALEGYDMTLFKDGRAIIEGTKDPTVAKNVYAKYIGL